MASGQSYNGWAANSDPSAIGINAGFSVQGIKFPGGLKGGDVSIVYTHLVQDLIKLDPPKSYDFNVEGFWGYSYRANVNNPSVLSCHASGTAIDWRAVYHPNTRSARYVGYTQDQITKIQALLAGKYRGLINWLPYDSMHYEVRGSAIQLNGLARALQTLPPVTEPPTEPNGGDEDMALSDADIKKIADAVWAKSIEYNRTDQNTGERTARKDPAYMALSAAASYSGYAGWNSKVKDT